MERQKITMAILEYRKIEKHNEDKYKHVEGVSRPGQIGKWVPVMKVKLEDGTEREFLPGQGW